MNVSTAVSLGHGVVRRAFRREAGPAARLRAGDAGSGTQVSGRCRLRAPLCANRRRSTIRCSAACCTCSLFTPSGIWV
jgi:hypothetical protein